MDNVSMLDGKQAQCNGKCISNFKSRKRLFIYKRHMIYSIDHHKKTSQQDLVKIKTEIHTIKKLSQW